MKLKQLQEKRGSLNKQIRDIIDKATVTESRSLNVDETTQVENIESEINQIDQTIHAEMRQMARESQNQPVLSAQETRDVARFDIGRALRALSSNLTLEGIELEMHQEGEREARAAGVFAAKGICLPTLITRGERRDVTATGTTSVTGDQGGMTIATNKAGLLDDFFNASIMRGLGATVLEGLMGNLDLPRITSGTAPAKKAENASADEYTPTTAMLSLTPKRLPAFIDISDQLLMQSSSAIEAILRSHLASQMLAVQELAFFHGGGTSEPVGIAGTSGIGSVAGGTNGAAPTWAHLVGLETEVDTDNALAGRLAYATNGQIRGKIKTTAKVASTDSIMLLDDRNPNTVNGYPIAFSNAISRTLTKGSSSGVASAIFFGNFADFVIGYWGGLNLQLITDSANAKLGMKTLVANTYYDAGVVRPKSFAAMLDALGA
jgi:HK97 family phage major capsid protein